MLSIESFQIFAWGSFSRSVSKPEMMAASILFSSSWNERALFSALAETPVVILAKREYRLFMAVFEMFERAM